MTGTAGWFIYVSQFPRAESEAGASSEEVARNRRGDGGSVRGALVDVPRPADGDDLPQDADEIDVWLSYVERALRERSVRTTATADEIRALARVWQVDESDEKSAVRNVYLGVLRDHPESWVGGVSASVALYPRIVDHLEIEARDPRLLQMRRLHEYLLKFESLDASTIARLLGHPQSCEHPLGTGRSTLASRCALRAANDVAWCKDGGGEFEYWVNMLVSVHSGTEESVQGILMLTTLLERRLKKPLLENWTTDFRRALGRDPTQEEVSNKFWVGLSRPDISLAVAREISRYPDGLSMALGRLAAIVKTSPDSVEATEARDLGVRLMRSATDWSSWLTEYSLRPAEAAPDEVIAWRELWRAQNPLHPIWADSRAAESKEARKFIDTLLAQADWAPWLASHHPDWGPGSPPLLETLLAARKAWVAEQSTPR